MTRIYTSRAAMGKVAGTGAAITIVLDFKPKHVKLINVDGDAQLDWYDDMAAGKGFKIHHIVPAGTVAAPTFTPSATAGDLKLTSPAFSGTGLTASGQTMTTTDNQTMTLNQCAGMWLIPATGATPPMLILSNTAVTAAPAVFTVQGSAATDAGTYKVARVVTTGTNNTPAFTGSSQQLQEIASGGVTVNSVGFSIGTDGDINVSGENIHWHAWRD